MKKLAILFALALCVALAGCNQPAPPQDGGASQEPSGAVSTPPAADHTEPTPSASGRTATLYIGTKSGGFNEYPMAYEGELAPEKLIQGIADLTGWDLTLAEDVISRKGGMSVCLSSESSLFIGPPDPQKEEFHMYDVGQLTETILDSIQKTLQEGFVLEPGDPENLDIWYFMEGGKPLELPILGLSWPIDQPYQWAGAENK